MRQAAFGFIKNYKKDFGGTHLLGKRKSIRPLSTKHPMHLILKSDLRFFNPTNQVLKKLIRNTAAKFNIKIYDFAPNWTHIHLIIKIQDRKDYVKFIRALSSLMAQAVNKAKGTKEKLFTLRPFTRILSWGRDFKGTLNYIIKNQLESFGLLNRKNDKKKVEKHSKRKILILC